LDCTEPEISLLLSDYFTGHLGPEEKQRVEDHLPECRICRLSLRTMLLIAGREKTREQPTETRHFSPQLLGRFYADPQSLDPRLLQQIESHLAVCSECAEDMAFLKNSDIDLKELLRSNKGRSGFRAMLEKLKQLLGVAGK